MPDAHRRLFIVTAVTLALFLSFQGLKLWNKADFCRGRGEHYQSEAASLKAAQQTALAENRTEDAARLELHARASSLISEKYLQVARNPLLPYPSKPLITRQELDADPALLQ